MIWLLRAAAAATTAVEITVSSEETASGSFFFCSADAATMALAAAVIMTAATGWSGSCWSPASAATTTDAAIIIAAVAVAAKQAECISGLPCWQPLNYLQGKSGVETVHGLLHEVLLARTVDKWLLFTDHIPRSLTCKRFTVNGVNSNDKRAVNSICLLHSLRLMQHPLYF